VSAATSAPPRPRTTSNGDRALAIRRKKRMLIIVNPYATTVSDRLKNLVVYALQGRYEVEAVSTQARDHATEIGREACDGGYDVVVAFGGDGTLNEVANGVAGTGIPVSVLPGGSTNVVCRTLGIPPDVVDATEHLLGLADRFEPRRVDLGIADGRRFVFACGAGLDATTTQRVDARPRLKARGGRWFYTSVAISSFYTRYLRDPVLLRLETTGGSSEGVTAVSQNSDPFTYFGGVPVRVCEGVAIDDGTLSVAMLRRAAQRDVPTIMARALSRGLRLADHRQVDHFAGVTEGRIEAVSKDREGHPRAFPVEVDGDYIGERTELELGIDPGALTVVA
jgi:diacylglycerol kinase family enzyme